MNQVKCPDCGEMYSEDLQSCPNCGCPNDNWKPKQEDKSNSKKPTATKENTIKSNTDWANYVYECGVLIWHTLTRKYLCFQVEHQEESFGLLQFSLLGFGFLKKQELEQPFGH